MSSEKGVFEQPQKLVRAIVSCLNQLVEQTPISSEGSSVFNLKTAPTISIADYVARMVKYMNASFSVYVYSLLLLDRCQDYNPEFVIHKKNIHRLLLVSNLVAAKYLDDMYYKNSFYATVGGISLKVLNDLQVQFLEMLNFNCHFERQTFQAYLQKLQLYAQINQRDQVQKQNILASQRQVKTREDLMVKEYNQTKTERIGRPRSAMKVGDKLCE